jgi:hypothetical protein
MKKKTTDTLKAILRKRNKLVTISTQTTDLKEKNALQFAIKIIDQLIDGDYILSPNLRK